MILVGDANLLSTMGPMSHWQASMVLLSLCNDIISWLKASTILSHRVF